MNKNYGDNGKGYTSFNNLGNTCFLNSCLQALKYTYELNNVLQNHALKKHIKKQNSDTIILNEWIELLDILWSNNGVISPNRFVHHVQKVAKKKKKDLFTGWSQNDMPEFLLLIIECLHGSLSRKMNVKISGTIKNNVDEVAVQCYNMMQKTYSKEYSEIMELFYGIYLSEIKSIDNQTRHSIVPEYYFMLDLPIPTITSSSTSKSIINIYDCFDLFIQPEYLQGENAWFNEKTNTKEDIQKSIGFWSFPKILVITLKRFSADGTHKINNLIECPLDNLDLSKYTSGYNASSNIYELYAVCNHIGNVYMGHYTAFVKHIKKDGEEWIHYNDEHIQKVEKPELVITPMAYCLFYRKKNNLL
jgi:ubiquitin C-terminal hydrolase